MGKTLFFIFLFLASCACKAQSVKMVSYIPLPNWVDTSSGFIIGAHVSMKEVSMCLYDSLGRLIRVENGKCSLIEMIWRRGKWVPYTTDILYKDDIADDLRLSEMPGCYLNNGQLIVADCSSEIKEISFGLTDAKYIIHRRGKHLWLTRKQNP